jgi:hypothetical protein
MATSWHESDPKMEIKKFALYKEEGMFCTFA